MKSDNAGLKVKVHYIGKLDDGTIFDSSYDRGEPVEYVCMNGETIKGFDRAVLTMEPGERKTVRVEPAEAYGEYDPAGVQKMPISSIPNGDQLPVGRTIYMQGDEGVFRAKVVSVEEGFVTLDLNHPLAGQALTFDIELKDVLDI